MEEETSDVAVVGYGLAFIYGIGLFIYLLAFVVSLFSPQYVLHSSLFAGKFANIAHFRQQALTLWVLFFPQWVAALGIIHYKEWARELLIGANLATCLFILYRNIGLHSSFDFFVSAFVMVSLVIILFFFQPRVKGKFQEGDSSRKRILIVDDDKLLLKMIKSTLASHGYEILTAATGEQGLVLARSRRPSLIILDVILPGIKGREVCSRLKEDPQTRPIPVIFLTAKDSPEDVKAELAAGGLSHITKPVHSQKLLTEIQRILGV